ncbi:protein kinase domain-containing protein [Kribbella sp. CA-294648]|uniref:serine/threonine-protein kinase n=1 Tax=Kribbella sp. CA-294648 TaxID=3239948 RepID=UPI003D91B9BA
MRTEESEGRLLAARYRLLEVLGRGGMGLVWHARDEVLDREVAVKEIVLPPELPEEERAVLRRRTLREARSAARLSDPNVVAVYDVVEEEGRPWIVMEFVKSRTLADVVRQDGPLPYRQVAKIGLQVLAALEAAHPAGVLHRDVKPSNVLLADDGRVVLTDFGIATLEGESTLTQSGTLVGSPAYIAPERVQARGAGPESDLWSLGATLYTAVEGRPPYERGNALTTLTAAVTEPPDPPRLAGPLWPALEGLLRKSPADRVDAATARQLLLQAATPITPATVPRPAPTPRPDADRGQGTRVLPVPPVVPEAEVPEVASASTSPVVPPPAPPPVAPPPPSGDRRPRLLPVLLVCLLLIAALGAWAAFRPDDDSPRSQSPGTSSAAPTVAPTSQPTAAGQSSAPPSSQPQTSQPQTSQPQTSQPQTSQPPSTRPQSSAPSTPAPTTRPTSRNTQPGNAGAVPAGFERHVDPTGFSLAVPDNWTVRREGSRVYFRESGGPRFLLIDQTDQPKADPVADWRQQEAARRDSYPEYRRIRLEAVDYFQKAADWEFSYAVRGGRQHVLNRGVVTSPQQAYGIYWSTPEGQWAASQDLWRTITDSFRPAT